MKLFRDDRSPDPQMFLLPPSVGEFVPQDARVRALSEVIDCLDLTEFYRAYQGGGAPAYDPRQMIKIWLFALLNGERSSRRIAAALGYDLRFMYLAKMNHPDFRTLCRFRKSHQKALEALFTQVVQLCAQMGLILLENVAADGTKLLANVSRKQTYCKERLDRTLTKVDERIARMLAEADAVDEAEDAAEAPPDPEKVPRKLRDLQRRKERLEAAKKQMDETAKSSMPATDLESRAMKTVDGVKAAYNAQAAVDGAHQIIVAASVTQAENDHAQLPAIIDQIVENTGCTPSRLLADKGYQGATTLEALKKHRIDGYVRHNEPSATRKDATYDTARDVYTTSDGTELVYSRLRVNNGVTYRIYRSSGRKHREMRVRQDDHLLDEMRAKLASPVGLARYHLRQEIVEPVFGHIKSAFNMRRLLLRGLTGATNEYLLACTAHNLSKLTQFWCENRSFAPA